MTEHDALRAEAIKRLKAKRDFRMHLGAYLIINAMFLAIWATSGGGGYFWPIWTIVFWGVGLAFHGWSVFFESSFSENDIQKEMERGNS